MAAEEEIITVQQAARLMGVHPMTVYKWIRTRGLPAFKPGGNGGSKRRWRIRRSELEDWMNINRKREVQHDNG